jgi:hypothetical protein
VEVVKHLKRLLRSGVRTVDKGVLPVRFYLNSRKPHPENVSVVGATRNSVAVHLINLASRPDRLRETDEEFARMGIVDWSRFDAVKSADGALGCALSHANLLGGLEGTVSAVMVCEDDIEFLVGPEELGALLEEFLANPALDVLCLAFNIVSRPYAVSEGLAVTTNIATTACYVAKGRAMRLLRDSFLDSAKLIEEGKPLGLAAADQRWKKLQRRTLIFAIPRVRAARQRNSFSDIEGKEVSYGV